MIHLPTPRPSLRWLAPATALALALSLLLGNTLPAAPATRSAPVRGSPLTGPTGSGPVDQVVPTPAGQPIPDQYIVVLQPGKDAKVEAKDAESKHGVKTKHVYEHALKGFSFQGPAQAAAALARNPNVKFISQDRTIS